MTQPRRSSGAEGPVAIWYDAATAVLGGAIVERAELDNPVFGSPDAGAPGLGAGSGSIERDLRVLADTSPAALVLLSDRVDSTSRVFDDRSLVDHLAKEIPVLASLEAPSAAAWDRISLLGAHRDAPSYRSVREAIGTEDAARTVVAISARPDGTGSARAALLDALVSLHDLMGPPERVDAARLSGTDSARVEFVAHLRFADDRAATIHASVGGPVFRRELTITTRSGALLRVDDGGLDWVSPSSEVIERREHRQEIDRADAIAAWLTRRLDPRLTPPDPLDAAAVHATAEAVLLSARTGDPERPAALTARIGV
ncbi:MAG: hypothetical protein AAGI30_03055 [Planctomycetota bacterium]